MAVLPNPFFDSPLEPAMAGDTAAGPVFAVSPDPAAVQFPRGFDPERFFAAIQIEGDET